MLVTPFIRSHRMPTIPKVNWSQNRNELEKSSKNFIEENITRMKNSLPKCPARYVVSDRKGNKFLIDGSGLQKDFICRKVMLRFNICRCYTFIFRVMVEYHVISKHVKHFMNNRFLM